MTHTNTTIFFKRITNEIKVITKSAWRVTIQNATFNFSMLFTFKHTFPIPICVSCLGANKKHMSYMFGIQIKWWNKKWWFHILAILKLISFPIEIYYFHGASSITTLQPNWFNQQYCIPSREESNIFLIDTLSLVKLRATKLNNEKLY